MRYILLFIAVLWVDIIVGDVETMSKDDLHKVLSKNPFVLVFFKNSDECPECNRALKYFEDVEQPDHHSTDLVKRVMLDEELSTQFGITQYPAVVFFRRGYPALYDGTLSTVDDVQEFSEWVETSRDIATKDLFDDSFEHLTQASTGATTGDWFVLFYKPECEDCIQVFPAFESAGLRVKNRMSFAKVDTEGNKKLTKRFKISKCPQAFLFKHGKMYEYEPAKYDTQSMVAFVDSWYKNVKASLVPVEPSTFDILIESIALYIKERMEDPERKWMVITAAVCGTLVLVGLLVLVCRRNATLTRDVNSRKFD